MKGIGVFANVKKKYDDDKKEMENFLSNSNGT